MKDKTGANIIGGNFNQTNKTYLNYKITYASTYGQGAGLSLNWNVYLVISNNKVHPIKWWNPHSGILKPVNGWPNKIIWLTRRSSVCSGTSRKPCLADIVHNDGRVCANVHSFDPFFTWPVVPWSDSLSSMRLPQLNLFIWDRVGQRPEWE